MFVLFFRDFCCCWLFLLKWEKSEKEWIYEKKKGGHRPFKRVNRRQSKCNLLKSGGSKTKKRSNVHQDFFSSHNHLLLFETINCDILKIQTLITRQQKERPKTEAGTARK